MVSRIWHIKSISDTCLKINTPDVLFHKHWLKKPMKESGRVPKQQLEPSRLIYPHTKYKPGTRAHMCINTHTHTDTHTPAHLDCLPSMRPKMWCDLNNDRCVCQGCGCHFKSMDGSIFPGRLSTSEGLTGNTVLQWRLENSKLSKWRSGGGGGGGLFGRHRIRKFDKGTQFALICCFYFMINPQKTFVRL